MKAFALVLTIAVAAFSQPEVDWTSPSHSRADSVNSGFWQLSPTMWRYYEVSPQSIRIMTGAYSNSPQVTIPLEPGESSIYVTSSYMDYSGDGVYDLFIAKRSGADGARGAYRVVNSATGATIYRFEHSQYSYGYPQPGDLDGDGLIEIYLQRYAYPQTDTSPSEWVVYRTTIPVTIVEAVPAGVPVAIGLEQNRPNPFNSSTRISYQLPVSGQSELTIFDSQGRTVATYLQPIQPAGSYFLDWNGRDRFGSPVGSGTYFYQLSTAAGVMSKKMILVK